MDYRILLVDDEADILEFMSYNLTHAGYTVYTAANGHDGVAKALEVKPHLILLDVMMPQMDGMEACAEIRRHKELSTTIIAFLTARGEDFSQIAGFEAGADDYITKTIRTNVLMSRIKALLKRHGEPASATVEASLTIDHERHIVLKDGRSIALPRKEFALLALLVSKPQRVFTREEIYDSVWGNDVFVGDRTIDVHIRKLREKIGNDQIITVKGIGYKYEP
ncbi:MAG: response regulator transcription factor [Rikenellaceae bacterium]|jgi:two-component system alkaline phosphatase synthesis response regulator PhoP|nr:response regulator transcription factor [Rikenellaceae bacterium]